MNKTFTHKKIHLTHIQCNLTKKGTMHKNKNMANKHAELGVYDFIAEMWETCLKL